jgi:hypothetical protein
MAPGLYKKIADFFKTAWSGVKKFGSSVLPVAKQILGFAAPAISMALPEAAPILGAINTGVGIADKFLNSTNQKDSNNDNSSMFANMTNPFSRPTNSSDSDPRNDTEQLGPLLPTNITPRFRSNLIRLRKPKTDSN